MQFFALLWNTFMILCLFSFHQVATEYTDLILHDTHCLHLLLFSRVQSTYIEDFHMDAAHNCWFNELNLNRSLFFWLILFQFYDFLLTAPIIIICAVTIDTILR